MIPEALMDLFVTPERQAHKGFHFIIEYPMLPGHVGRKSKTHIGI